MPVVERAVSFSHTEDPAALPARPRFGNDRPRLTRLLRNSNFAIKNHNSLRFPYWEIQHMTRILSFVTASYARGLRHSALRAGSWSSLGTSRQLLKINSAKLRNTTPPAKSSATSQPEEVRLGSKAWCHSSRIAVINVMLTASSVHRVRMERNALGRDEVS